MSPTKIDKKEVIRQATLELFLKQGYSATSTDAICRQAAISKETLYRYFPNKTELLIDILKEMTVSNSLGEKSSALWQQAILQRHLAPALYSLANGLLATMMNPVYLALLKIIMAEGQHLPELEPFIRDSIPRKGLSNLTDYFYQAQQAGLMKPGSPELLARFFVGPMLSYLIVDGLLAPQRQPLLPSPEKVQEIVSTFVEFAVISDN